MRCGLILATIGNALSQSPSPSAESEKGSVSGNTYENPALGITWELQKDWTLQNKSASLLGDDYFVFLRILSSGAQPQELIELDYSSTNRQIVSASDEKTLYR